MNHRELRRTFLEFYARRGHKIVPSSSLLPRDDPTLLFTAAGMVQFKPYWAGTIEPPYRRACSIQKCLRASDLEQVGHTPRHCTFFEMLGNFSFGDYFKAEAIPWAWEYLTEVVKLDRDRLYVSVYEQDDEAYDIWHKTVGLPAERIVRLGEKDNFWGPAGGGGACGPCSEIYVDLGPEYGCGKETCAPGCDCDRFSEVYNIVFPQFNQLPDGTRLPLKNRGIDTGMGLERLAMVSQGKKTIFDTDLFLPIVKEADRVLFAESSACAEDAKKQTVLHIAADHARALTFAITDGVIPANEARGYVLRGILRRAVLFAHRLGVKEPFLYRISAQVVEHMRQFYPELAEKREQVGVIIKAEEERFLRTLDAGLDLWRTALKRHRDSGVIPGEEIFRLHDTYGFHVELVKELANQEGLQLDLAGFEAEMEKQRQRSRKTVVIVTEATAGVRESRFVGYDRDEVETELFDFTELQPGRLYELYLRETPFYATAGGQVGDTGRVRGPGFELEVVDSYYRQGVRVAKAKLLEGEVAKGIVTAEIDRPRRREIERAHTATHLLHAALRQVVGEYVKQEGSLVEPGRLRFDFAAFEPLTEEQLSRVEALMFDRILADVKLKVEIKSLEEAKAMGALAFFGEQYGETVRVVQVPGFSIELCAGTHLRSTGEIGVLRIMSETGVAAGVRRIEALVGQEAFRRLAEERLIMKRLRETLQVGEEALLTQKITALQEENRRLEAKLKAALVQLARNTAEELAAAAEKTEKATLVLAYLPQLELPELRLVADRLRERLAAPYAGFLAGASSQGRLRYLVFVSPDLKQALPAGQLAKTVGQAMSGGGGGKADLAEGAGMVDRLESGRQAFRAAFGKV